ncbi:hypothetical protein AYM40_21010 [Paraburkholderia phytofirmans OLGA172]|uniref:Uncharacterized protein n=1 Tax=Paraburkholderia phytofirmans OLGA172 TaxID=1417228 RepID=A0A161I2N1_9BURK|nr:hypothetical protein AYM40_21010 [Paraburkholderia phytofirmans OLGA172]
MVRRDDDTYRLAGAATAWVLICDARTFKADSAAFRDAQRKLEARTSIDPTEEKTLLRAMLDLLAKQGNK